MTPSATTTFPVDWCREQFPALGAQGRRAAGRLSRRPGRQPGAAARDRRDRRLPARRRTPTTAGCSPPAARATPCSTRPIGPWPTCSAPTIAECDRLRREHDDADVRLQPGAGAHLEAGRRGDRHAAGSRRQRHAPGCWRRATPAPRCSYVDVRRRRLHARPGRSCAPALAAHAAGGRGLRVERGRHDQPGGRDLPLGARRRRRRCFSTPCTMPRTR